MKSIKSTVKSFVHGTVIGAGLLVATSVFADHRGWDHNDHDRGHEQHERHFDRDHEHGRDYGRSWKHHDFYRDRHGYDRHYDRNRFGLRLLLPLPPRIGFPILPPPPVPVFITSARVIDVAPVVSDYRNDDWNDGYRVTYEFHGQEYTTVMPYDPGEQIRIRVGNGIEVLQ